MHLYVYMYLFTYVIISISTSIKNHEFTLMPPITVHYQSTF